MEMQTLASPLIYLMVAINPGTEQWEAVNSEGVFDCPSSDDLRLIRRLAKGGSGSSGVRV
jgi:hypothetical protein